MMLLTVLIGSASFLLCESLLSKNLCPSLNLGLASLKLCKDEKDKTTDKGNLCPPLYISCNCGESGLSINIPVEQCRTQNRRRAECKLCNKKFEPHLLCEKFNNCMKCNATTYTCSDCPYNKYGLWCNEDCNCKNAIGCHQETGRCICMNGFNGEHCEVNTGGTSMYIDSIWYKLDGTHVEIVRGTSATEDTNQVAEPLVKALAPPADLQSSTENKIIVRCQTPKPITNGKMDYEEPGGRELSPGITVKFQCDEMYALKGNDTITCLPSGKWSTPSPECIKVPLCEEPPSIMFGRVEISDPKPGGISRSALSSNVRTNNLPSGHQAGISPSVVNSQQPNITIPPGFYKIGSSASYSCLSRYYKLVGSKTRRCQVGGTWSGRVSSCIPVCGRSDSARAPFILYGNATEIGQWPWQTALSRFMSDDKQWFLVCGGALLNEQWVMTAAHCVTTAGTDKLLSPDMFKIDLGKYYRDDKMDDESVQSRKISEIHIHSDYDPHMFDADIALILLDTHVTLTSRVQPVCLPTGATTRDHIVEGQRGVITGWGLNENHTYSQQLRQAALPVVTYKSCEKTYQDANLPLTVTENMYCAGIPNTNIDICSGDSGGPMVFPDDTGRERMWVLEGIVSWGSPLGCGNTNQFGGFTKVYKFMSWIHQFF